MGSFRSPDSNLTESDLEDRRLVFVVRNRHPVLPPRVPFRSSSSLNTVMTVGQHWLTRCLVPHRVPHKWRMTMNHVNRTQHT